MLQTFNNAFTSLINNIRIVDILDIALVSFILYFILNWMRQNVSKRSIVSFLILVFIYAVVRATGMYLTELLIEAFFIVFLIGLVIVFQSDVRRLAGRVGDWHIFDKSGASVSNSTTDVITEAVIQMAKQKRGALIAVRGKDNWDRLTHGGTDLKGDVTATLLYSIFNTEAPGHDGAVLLYEHTVTGFGVHLPLSTNLNKISKGGTRHAAALGLAEQCDAFVVVVSEERGTISIAQNGHIQPLTNDNDLKERLDDFWNEHYNTSDSVMQKWWKRSSLQTAAGAVVLAFVLWLAFVYQPGTVYRTFEVPIEYRNLQSATTSIQKSLPTNARITLSGSTQAFENFEANNLVVSFNLASENAQDGVLEIGPQNLNLPSDLTLYEVSPQRLLLPNENNL